MADTSQQYTSSAQQGQQVPPAQYASGPQQYPNQQPIYIPVPTKSAGLAAVLAFLIPGLGHIYLGKIGEGLFYLIISIVMAALSPFTLFVLFIPLVVIWIWQIYDAYKKANQYNSAVQQTGRAPW